MQGPKFSREDAEATILASERLTHALSGQVSSGLQISTLMINNADADQLRVWKDMVVAEIHMLEASVLATLDNEEKKAGLRKKRARFVFERLRTLQMTCMRSGLVLHIPFLSAQTSQNLISINSFALSFSMEGGCLTSC